MEMTQEEKFIFWSFFRGMIEGKVQTSDIKSFVNLIGDFKENPTLNDFYNAVVQTVANKQDKLDGSKLLTTSKDPIDAINEIYKMITPATLSAPVLTIGSGGTTTLIGTITPVLGNNGYSIYGSPTENGTYTLVTTVTKDINIFQEIGISGIRWYKAITLGNGTTTYNSPMGIAVSGTTATIIKLTSPVIDTVTPDSINQITINMLSIPNNASYLEIEYKKSTDTDFTIFSQTLPRITISQIITGLLPNTTYQIRTTAIGNGSTYLNSDPSLIKTVTTAAISTKLSTPVSGTVLVIAQTVLSIPVYNIDSRCSYVKTQYKKSTDSVWIDDTYKIQRSDFISYLFGLEPGTLYDIRFITIGTSNISNSDPSLISSGTTSIYVNPLYIDPSASINGNGTISNPFNGSTFDTQYAQAWTNNTTYLIKKGTTWNRTWTLNLISKNDVILGAYGSGTRPKVTGGFIDGTNSIMDFGSSYRIGVHDLEIYGRNYNKTSEVAPLCSIKMNGTSSILSNLTDILNCNIHSTYWGIRGVTDVDRIRVLGGEISYTLDDGIFYQGATNCEFGYINIHDINEKWYNIQTQEHAGGDCIQIDGHINGLTGLHIHHCTLDHSTTGLKFCLIYESIKKGDIITIEHNKFLRDPNSIEQCIYVSGQQDSTHTTYFRHNYIPNAKATAYWSTTGHINSEFINNIICNTDRALELYSTQGVKVYNNTFINANVGIEHENHETGIDIKNNIFNLNTGQKAFNFHGSSVTNAGITIDYNCYSIETADMFLQCLTSYSTLNAWKIFTGQESHSFIANPLFVDSNINNFNLQELSPCKNTGVSIEGYTPISNINIGSDLVTV